MKPVIYLHNGKSYRKLERHEIIKEGAMQSWCQSELYPANGSTVGDTPAHFANERDFYNLVKPLRQFIGLTD